MRLLSNLLRPHSRRPSPPSKPGSHATSWEHVSPDDPERGEVLFWLARAEELGKMAAARREAQLSDSLLRRSTLPAFRRLVEAKPGFR